ncbi:MAG: lasso peptide biosynthesis PqqD family chaperone [Negativicutes bacterium]
MQSEINFDSVVAQGKEIVMADIDASKVLLSIEQGKYYGMDEIGGRIWELIEMPQTVQWVVAQLLREYGVEAETCEKDVLHFLRGLAVKGLIQIG